MSVVKVCLLKTHEEFRRCEELQKAVWGSLSVSSEVMIVTQKFGGAVIGSFLGQKLVGFLYAFLAERGGELVHWSHLMAVAPAYQNGGLGFRMKLAHRNLALERGIRSICWTYDPLQSRNATLNIARLGARPEDYIVDCYGRFPSVIEKGLPSDRFVLNWRSASVFVRQRLRQGPPTEDPLSLPCVNEAVPNSRGFLENQRVILNFRDKRLAVEIPPNTDDMRAKSLPLARRWRMETRKIFLRYLGAGYRVDEFIPPGKNTSGRCFYILQRKS